MTPTARDCQLVIMGGPFGRMDLAHVTGFDSRQHTVSIRVDRIDGTQLAAELPKGWEGMFELERGSAAADGFIALIEVAHSDGLVVPSSTLYQYVSEPDGSTSTYQYEGALFRIPLAASHNLRGPQRIEFFANHRRRI